MNENVTNKAPKRRRWIARLLVSAFCILLASSLLFVGVVAENIELVAQFIGTYSIAVTPSFVYPISSTDFVYSDGFFVYYSSANSVLSAFDVRSSENYNSTYSNKCENFFYDILTDTLYGIGYKNYNSYYSYLTIFEFVIDSGSIVDCYSSSYRISYNLVQTYHFGIAFALMENEFYCFLCMASNSASSDARLDIVKISGGIATCYFSGQYINNDFGYLSCFVSDYFAVLLSDATENFMWRISDNAVTPYDLTGRPFYYDGNYYCVNSTSLLIWNGSGFDSVGNGVSGNSFFASNSVLYSYLPPSSMSVSYTVYSGLPTTETPPESSDETTEPPPESSEDSSDDPSGSMIDVYKVSPGSDPAFVQSVDFGSATIATVFLGSYFITDDAWSDTSQYCYIQLYSDSGPLDRITFDFYATGFSYDNVSWDYPKIIGTNFDIDISNLETLYLSTLSPFGTVTVQNETSVLRQFNFQSSTAYVEIENTSAEEALWYVYGSDTDSSPATFTTAGMQKYIIRRQSGSTTIPVLIDYCDSGIVSAGLVYNGAPFPVGGIIITDDPYLIPPIDTGSWDNVLSQAQSGQELEQSIADKLNSYIDDAFNTVSFDGDISDSFVNGVGVLGDILDTSGGSVIVNFFANMWTIHPYSLAMVGLVSTFLIFSFILRKS